jgi:hypothetical protein
MKRTPLQRKTPLKRSRAPKSKPKPVSTDLYAEVVRRDMGCVAQRLVPEIKCAGRLDPHHVLMRSQGGQDTAQNLKTLCRAHHDWVHNHPALSYELDLLRRRP